MPKSMIAPTAASPSAACICRVAKSNSARAAAGTPRPVSVRMMTGRPQASRGQQSAGTGLADSLAPLQSFESAPVLEPQTEGSGDLPHHVPAAVGIGFAEGALRVSAPLANHDEQVVMRAGWQADRDRPAAVLSLAHGNGSLLPIREITGQ